MLFEWLKAKYGDNHPQVRQTETEFPYQIELESGECFNVKGF